MPERKMKENEIFSFLLKYSTLEDYFESEIYLEELKSLFDKEISKIQNKIDFLTNDSYINMIENSDLILLHFNKVITMILWKLMKMSPNKFRLIVNNMKEGEILSDQKIINLIASYLPQNMNLALNNLKKIRNKCSSAHILSKTIDKSFLNDFISFEKSLEEIKDEYEFDDRNFYEFISMIKHWDREDDVQKLLDLFGKLKEIFESPKKINWLNNIFNNIWKKDEYSNVDWWKRIWLFYWILRNENINLKRKLFLINYMTNIKFNVYSKHELIIDFFSLLKFVKINIGEEELPDFIFKLFDEWIKSENPNYYEYNNVLDVIKSPELWEYFENLSNETQKETLMLFFNFLINGDLNGGLFNLNNYVDKILDIFIKKSIDLEYFWENGKSNLGILNKIKHKFFYDKWLKMRNNAI